MAVLTIAGAWGVYAVFLCLRLAIAGTHPHRPLLIRHVVTVVFGVALTALIHQLLRLPRRRTFGVQMTLGVLMAIPAALLLSAVIFWVTRAVTPAARFLALPPGTGTLRGMMMTRITELFLMFAGWAALYTSILNARASAAAHARAANLEIARRDAELAALRYQLNPHFLFNALNAISALMLRGDVAGAEATLQRLSLFLRGMLSEAGEARSGLAGGETTLSAEIAHQRLYLEIEQVRFGTRLHTCLSVPEALAGLTVPSLLLQPLIENTLRHAVAAVDTPVTLTVHAERTGDLIEIVVEDDGPGLPVSGLPTAGTGLGLGNVAARLAARYGGRARLTSGPRAGGGFRNVLLIPLDAMGG